MKKSKRVFGRVEAAFDILYLLTAFLIGTYLLYTGETPVRKLAGIMAVLLGSGDLFHLIPRIAAILTGQEERWARAMGFGKFISSITMTVFYLLLWRIGLLLFGMDIEGKDWDVWNTAVYLLASGRILLCLFPQNGWLEHQPPVRWGIYRNLPFLLLGAVVAVFFAVHGGRVMEVDHMWIAITLSFGFYLPVVLWVHRNPKLGMLMLPKTCTYVWMLVMCLFL